MVASEVWLNKLSCLEHSHTVAGTLDRSCRVRRREEHGRKEIKLARRVRVIDIIQSPLGFLRIAVLTDLSPAFTPLKKKTKNNKRKHGICSLGQMFEFHIYTE